MTPKQVASVRARIHAIYARNSELDAMRHPGANATARDAIDAEKAQLETERRECENELRVHLEGKFALEMATFDEEEAAAHLLIVKAQEGLATANKSLQTIEQRRLRYWQEQKYIYRDAGLPPLPSPISKPVATYSGQISSFRGSMQPASAEGSK